ncbi:gephyrin [Bacillus rossius redtenbacheri]|uniref:gephyrin n=1 Tax=Bacillus rossius redtenbacheri TaxID=93214 RepID=UPI002FDC93F9
MKISFGILTVSDRCSLNIAEDKSGNNLENLIRSEQLIGNGEVVVRHCVPDDKEEIKQYLKLWTNMGVDIVLTTGGTGFGPRDVTPEATRDIVDREAPGLAMAMFMRSLEVTPLAMLSRPLCGIRSRTLIINLPGSTKGSQECFESIAMSLPHAVALLRNAQAEVENTHQQLEAEGPKHHHHLHHGLSHHHHHHHHHSHHRHSQAVVDSKVDVSKVARRARTSAYPLIDVQTAQQTVLEHARVLGTETVKFKDALGRVLSEDVVARDALPPFPASIKDGYAVIAGDGAGPRTVLGDSTAGVKPDELEPLKTGQCARINTGAPVPAGADCVVQVEDTRLLKDADDGRVELEVEILVAPKVGQDIRPVGSDIKEGEVVLRKGAVLGPSELGLLATVGVVHIQVYKLPVTCLLSTGNELQEPGQPLEPGHIRDSNKTTLIALLQDHGFPVEDIGIAKDNPKSMLAKMKEALSAGDLVVTTGSVSMGERDILKEVLVTDLGATVHFGRVFMKPGKPTTFATCEYDGKRKLVLGLPGNPVSATVTSHLYVLPALRKMSGCRPLPTIIKAITEDDLILDPRPEYHRVVLSWETQHTVPTAKSTGNQISSRLLSCSAANALLILPPRSDSVTFVARGKLVDAMIIARI